MKNHKYTVKDADGTIRIAEGYTVEDVVNKLYFHESNEGEHAYDTYDRYLRGKRINQMTIETFVEDFIDEPKLKTRILKRLKDYAEGIPQYLEDMRAEGKKTPFDYDGKTITPFYYAYKHLNLDTILKDIPGLGKDSIKAIRVGMRNLSHWHDYGDINDAKIINRHQYLRKKDPDSQ